MASVWGIDLVTGSLHWLLVSWPSQIQTLRIGGVGRSGLGGTPSDLPLMLHQKSGSLTIGVTLSKVFLWVK